MSDDNAELEARVNELVEEKVRGIKANHDKLLAEKKELQKRVSEFSGLDPEEVRKAVAEMEKVSQAKLREAGEYEKLLADTEAKFSKELEHREQKIKALEDANRRAVLDREIGLAIATADAINPDTVVPLIEKSLKVVEGKDGTYSAVVVDEHGEPRLREKAKNAQDFLRAKDLVGEMKTNPDLGHLFKAPDASGGGAPPGSRSGGQKSGSGSSSFEGSGAYLV